MNIAVLLSGGVDSSLALRLLHAQGAKVTAFYLKIWLEDELSYLGTCPWQEDLAYAQAVCDTIGVPLEVISLQKEYHDQVVSYTLDQIKKGFTPNPDMLCNQRIKFGAFYNLLPQSFDYIATGHYAQRRDTPEGVELLQAPDPIKDQTYFLSQLSQKQLSRALFPIGEFTKAQVRELANQYQLPTAMRKDSQGICFLGKLKFSDFIKHHVGECKGDLIEFETGKIMGSHNGFWYYTIGQRQGLGLAGGPWYVVAKNPQENIVYISRNYYSPEKSRNEFLITDCNWITKLPSLGEELQVKLRHGPFMHTGILEIQGEGIYKVTLRAQDQGIASGQFAVFYQNKLCLGGGTITASSLA